MEKICYLIWARVGRDLGELATRLASDVGPRIAALPEVLGLTVHVAAATGPAVTADLLAAHVGVWVQVHDRRQPIEALLAPLADRLEALLVTESVYVRGAERPAAVHARGAAPARTISLYAPPTGLALPEAPALPGVAGWSTWLDGLGARARAAVAAAPGDVRYVRNVAARALTQPAPRHRVIVEEGAPALELPDRVVAVAVHEHVLVPSPA